MDRPDASHITDDQLDRLYAELEEQKRLLAETERWAETQSGWGG